MSYSALYSTIATLSLILLIGYIAGKLNIIDGVSTERLSTFIIKIGQPFLIINALIGVEYTPENLKTGLAILALGLCMHAGMAVVAYFLARGIKTPDERKLSEYSMFLANCGFLGFPIIESLYGQTGLFYGAFYFISYHLFVWTWGIMILARGRDDIKLTPKKVLLNFGTLPCIIGFLIFVSNINLPDFAYSLSSYLAGVCTPIAIIISGANIARRSFTKMMKNPLVYGVCSVKLLLMPVLATVVLWLLGLPDYLVVFGGIMAAMPCPAVVTMFGEMYKVSPGYAAELVGASTILSAVTIIPVATFAQWIVSLR